MALVDWEALEQQMSQGEVQDVLGSLGEVDPLHLDSNEALKLKELLDKAEDLSPDFLEVRALAAVRLGDWVSAREGMAALQRKGAARQAAHIALLLPETGNAEMLRILFDLTRMGEKAEYSPVFGAPSVLRGIKDLSDWGRNHLAVRALLRDALQELFAAGGTGVGEGASAEVLYERGDFGEALRQAETAMASPAAEIAYTGAILAAHAAVMAQGSPAVADDYIRQAEKAAEGAVWLSADLEAAKARFAAFESKKEALESWLGASGGQADYHPCNRYQLLARARALLALEKKEEAAQEYGRLCEALRTEKRPLDMAEALCGAALCAGELEQAATLMRQALELCAPFRFGMVLAEFGAPAASLLQKCDIPGAAQAAQLAQAFSLAWGGSKEASAPAAEEEVPAQAEKPVPDGGEPEQPSEEKPAADATDAAVAERTERKPARGKKR